LVANYIDRLVRYFIQLSYNGKNYCGWQRQPHSPSVQEELEEAIRTGFVPVTLGESRLRTETAGLIALQWLHTLHMLSLHHTTENSK